MQQKMQWLEFSGTHLYSWPERSTVTVKGLVHGHNIAMRWSWIQLNIFQCIGICIIYNLQNNLVIKFNRSAQSCFSGSAWDRPVLSKGNIECSTHSGNYLWEGEGALDLLRLPHFLPDPSYTIPMGGKLVQPSHDYSFQATINIHDWITGRKMGGWDKECLRVANCSRFEKTIPKKTAWELKDSAKMISSISYEHTPLIEVSLLKLYMWTSTNLLWPQPSKYVWISLSRSFTFKASVWKQINMQNKHWLRQMALTWTIINVET